MSEDDFDTFVAMHDSVCAMISRGKYVASDESTALFFNAMRRYSLATVRAAFDAHVGDAERGKFVPVPADLIAQIEGMLRDDGRLGAEEAWALAVRAQDERETVVWTAEIAQAFNAARPVLDRGDDVGARMAFREAYGRIVTAARADMAPVRWQATLGHDLERRQVAIEAAIAAGRLVDVTTGAASDVLQLPGPRASAVLLLAGESAPNLEVDPADPDHVPIPAPPEARAALLALRDRLRGQGGGLSVDAAAKADTAERRADARAKLLTVDETIALVAEVRATPGLLEALRDNPDLPRRRRAERPTR